MTTGFVFFLSSVYGAATTTQPVVVDQNLITPMVEQVEAKTLEHYVREHYSDTPVLAEIARCESGFVHFTDSGKILRGRVDNNDVGLMQINERFHLAAAKKLGYDIYSIEGNMAYAKYIYEKDGAAPWYASSKCWGKHLKNYEVAMR